jgi:prephenate dehydrogenase
MDDSNPDFFIQKKVAIVGLGLMGGSLALALRGKCASLLGIDTDPQTLALALRQKVVDEVCSAASQFRADVIVLAAPVKAIVEWLARLPNLHSEAAVVIDLGSTKRHILEEMQKMPQRFDPVGGHPMCGKESSSLANADPLIYLHAPFALVPLERSTPAGRHTALQLAYAVGAIPLWMDPLEHDRRVAATSHLPYLVANALAAVTPLDAAALAGPGFTSTTRLASSSPQMMMDILTTNRENILTAARLFRTRLEQLEHVLEQNDPDYLQELLLEGASRREMILHANNMK